MKLCTLTLCVALAFLSCNKKQNETTPENNIVVKGSISLYITAMHHTWTVSNISIFMKKNATLWPGTDTTLYGWRAVTDASGTVLIRDLFPGKYYLYAKGFDSTFGANVIGYIPVDLNSSSVENNEAYYTIPVSE